MDTSPKRLVGPSAMQTGSRTLRRIADALAVPVEALSAPREPVVLHNAVDGASWLLVRVGQGRPIVRHITAVGDTEADLGVSAFLAEDIDSPQRQALADLIDDLLTTHLAN